VAAGAWATGVLELADGVSDEVKAAAALAKLEELDEALEAGLLTADGADGLVEGVTGVVGADEALAPELDGVLDGVDELGAEEAEELEVVEGAVDGRPLPLLLEPEPVLVLRPELKLLRSSELSLSSSEWLLDVGAVVVGATE
jgi:hypothetical protein